MSYRVYLIEDESIVARDVQYMLERLGHVLIGHARDSATALTEIPELAPDILLSDIRIGEAIDGIEIVEQLKRDILLPVIFISAYSDKETLQRAKQVKPQGYVIKPINRRELEIAMDIAVDEFQREKTLAHNESVLRKALSSIGNSVFIIQPNGVIESVNTNAAELLKTTVADCEQKNWQQVIQCSFEQSLKRLNRLIENAMRTKSVSQILPLEINVNNRVILVDGIVGPTFNEFEECNGTAVMLRQLVEISTNSPLMHQRRQADVSQANHPKTCLLLINPDDFEKINSEYGADIGDLILSEISLVINKEIRYTDLAAIYGGAVFSATLPNTDYEEGLIGAKRLHNKLTNTKYFSDKISLTFSIGFAVTEGTEDFNSINTPITLFRHATWALNYAHEAGGNCVQSWQKDKQHLLANIDRGSGKFSQNMDSDLNGLMLVWNTVSAVAQVADLVQLSEDISRILTDALNLKACFILVKSQNEPIEVIAKNVAADETSNFDESKWLNAGISQLFDTAERQVFVIDINFKDVLCYAVQLRVEDRVIGVLLLIRAKEQVLNREQVSFIESLGEYLGVAIDRLLLSDKQQIKIDEQLTKFQGSMDRNELIYQSDLMEDLLEQIKTIAPTDAPVMITGESGTGKELLAKTVHDLSDRSNAPFVVVDCAAIVPSLMESELFGHKKGAYTGANEVRHGRFLQADGGTVFIDEIGELPLELQMKLLRFAQEKTFTPVGDSITKHVDVRLIVATNRDLAYEVDKGRFRSDLYYRLNVFMVHSPPLRCRQEDIVPISKHFITAFSRHYLKRIHGLTQSAELLLKNYHWPGNVRELRNVIMRAVIMCQSPLIDKQHLQIELADTATELASQHAVGSDVSSEKAKVVANLNHDSGVDTEQNQVIEENHTAKSEAPATWESITFNYQTANTEPSPVDTEDYAANQDPAVTTNTIAPEPPQPFNDDNPKLLAGAPAVNNRDVVVSLANCVKSLIDTKTTFDLGHWLEGYLAHKASHLSRGKMCQAAKVLAMPESTYRRKLEAYQPDSFPRQLQDEGKLLSDAIDGWLLSEWKLDISRVKYLKQALVEQAIDLGLNRIQTSKLAGVSEPTLRKMLAN